MHQQIHQNIAHKLIEQYQGQEPLAIYLKKYFAANKKHGSKDRKSISAFCFDHYRQNVDIFPLQSLITKEIVVKDFIASHTIQPLLFIRVRPWQKEKVIQKLKEALIYYKEIGESTLAFTNTTSLQQVLELNKEAVIQDLSSQQIASFLKLVPTSREEVINVWDACAASGGKSILMYDYLENIKIHVSDIRESILHNCEKRLKEAGIRPTSLQLVDLTFPFEIKKQFDFVFADVPCSGSGTWGRTPEQIFFFKEKQLDQYTLLQEQIIENMIPALKLNGHLLYVTCSVYEKENENQIQKLVATGKFTLIKQQYLVGYKQQADTLFGALLKKIKE